MSLFSGHWTFSHGYASILFAKGILLCHTGRWLQYFLRSAEEVVACDVIHVTVAKLKSQYPKAFVTITGDFNHVNLDSNPTFHQVVDCTTWENSIIFMQMLKMHRATALPKLGKSDHNLILLKPQYVPAVQRQPVSTRTVRRWTLKANEVLQDCFETTD